MYNGYSKRTMDGDDFNCIMDSLGISRYCCRRMFLTHVHTMAMSVSSFNKCDLNAHEKNMSFFTSSVPVRDYTIDNMNIN